MSLERNVHLVSDATGETINSIARACLVQFENVKIQEYHWNLIRTKRQINLVLESIKQNKGLVLYTFVDKTLRNILVSFCEENEISCIPVLDPVMNALSSYLGKASSEDPGRQHVMDAEYFSRIEAMDFALALDDGNKSEFVKNADVLILGVSRTSKTPTCVYLANRGIKAANIPLIPGVPLGVDLESLTRPLIVGLTKDPDSLVEIRKNRMNLLNEKGDGHYTDPEKVKSEVMEAKRLFAKIGCPVIDVTRKSIEETSAEIIMLLNEIKAKSDAQKQ